MDSKLLLVKVLTLVFKESRLGDQSGASTSIANEILDGLRLPEAGADFDRSRETLIALKATAKFIIESPNPAEIDKSSLLQRIRVNVTEDDWLYEAIAQGINDDPGEDQLKIQCANIRRELREYQDHAKVTEIMKKGSYRLMFQPESVPDVRSFVRDMTAELEPFSSGFIVGHPEGHVDALDLSDAESVKAAMRKGMKKTSTEGILKVGWQGINRMTGDHMGVRRGEAIVVGALQHNYKTGFTLKLFKHMALYNVPWMKDTTKKPCLVHISLEDDLDKNILSLYVDLKEHETGEVCDLNAVKLLSEEEQEAFYVMAAEYVMSRLSATGYHIKMVRWDPSQTTFHSTFDYLNGLQAEGYEIHAVVIDYLNMMSKRGCTEGPMGSNIRDLWRRFRNYMAP